MKKKWMRSALLAALAWPLLLNVAVPARAQEALTEDQLRREPGYVDFGDLWKWSDGDQEMEIELTQPLLGVVGAFVKGEDPDLSELIKNLHLVKVNGFSFGRDDEEAVTRFIGDTAKKLNGSGWDSIVKMRERGEEVNVFVKFEGNGRSQSDTFLSGLAVLALEDESATFVNVVGRFRLEDIAKVGQHFDIPSAGEWDHFDRRGRDSGDDAKKEGGR